MFEDSLISSGARKVSARTRWTALASFGLQAVLGAAIVLVPMLRPASLPVVIAAPRMTTVELRRAEVTPPRTRAEVVPASHSVAMPASSAVAGPRQVATMVRGGRLNVAAGVESAGVDAPALAIGNMGNGGGAGVVSAIGPVGGGPVVVAAAPVRGGAVRVSQGISSGMLLEKIVPVYPRIAVAAKVEGTVVVAATIGRSGRIENLRVVSGPEMLRGAAMEAIQVARYRPYLLNGEATEVETTISVVFRIGG